MASTGNEETAGETVGSLSEELGSLDGDYVDKMEDLVVDDPEALGRSDRDDEEELAILRKLLQAEKTADAVELLHAQSSFLRSSLTSGVEINDSLKTDSAEIERLTKAGTTFKTATAADMFDDETFKYDDNLSPSTNNSPTRNSEATLGDDEMSTLITLDVPGGEKEKELNVALTPVPQACMADLYDSFEENQCLEMLLASIPPALYTRINKLDTNFREVFTEFCRLCLRARNYLLPKALALLKRQISWREKTPFFKSLEAGEVSRQEAISALKAILDSGSLLHIPDAVCKDGMGVLIVRFKLLSDLKLSQQDLELSLYLLAQHAFRLRPRLQYLGFSVLFDLSAVNSQSLNMKLFEGCLSSLNRLLPLKATNMYVLNPPLYFRTVKRWYKMLKADSSRLKLVYKHKSSPVFRDLYQYFDQTDLPVFYGGLLHIQPTELAQNVVASLP